MNDGYDSEEDYEVYSIDQGTEQQQKGMQQQSVRAQLGLFLVVITMPLFSPFYLLGLLFYQFCLVEKLSWSGKGVTLVASIFLSVAWIPYANIIIFYTVPNQRNCINNVVNAFLPVGMFYVFCIWLTIAGLRHFSIADSYEHEQDRSHLRHLKKVELNPPIHLKPLGDKHGGAKKSSSTIDILETKGAVHTAFDLYWILKGSSMPWARQAFAIAMLLTIAVVTPSRIISRRGGDFEDDNIRIINDPNMTNLSSPQANCEFFRTDPDTGERVYVINQESTLFVLSTIQFCGIFWVFFSVLAFVVVQFLHEIRLLKNLRACLPDLDTYRQSIKEAEVGTPNFPAWSVNGNLNGFRLNPVNLTHVHAWDEVRRAAVQELTSSRSVFNSIFFPTVLIMTLGAVGCYTYVVVRLLFQGQRFGFFTAPLTVFAVIMFLFLMLVFLLARSAGSSMKSHRSIVAKISFDVSRELDTQLDLRLTGASATTGRDGTSSGGGGGGGSSRAPHSVITEDLLNSLIAMRTYLVGNCPRIKLLSIEDHHVRFALLFFLLINGNVMFFALMIAIRDGDCRPDTLHSGSAPVTVESIHLQMQ